MTEFDPALKEQRRLDALAEYQILDTPRERDFDDIAKLASDICGTPIAVVNLIGDNRQFFKAEVGLNVRETPFESSFCAKAILEQDFLIVSDATKDDRFDCNPLVIGDPHLRFYAGAILKTEDGLAIGTVCVLDYQPRELTELQQRTLRVLARQVMTQLELRRTLRLEANARRKAEIDTSRYQAVFNSAIDYAIVVMDTRGTITDWNEGAVKVLGWSATEMVGRDISSFFTPEDCEHGIPEREMSIAVEAGFGMDERWHLRKTGQRFWASGEMMPLKSELGQVEGFVKILRDRTAQRLLEERLDMSLSASGGVSLWDWMLDTDLLYGDAHFARMYGLDVKRAASGMTMEAYQEFVVPEDIPDLRAKLRDVFDHGAEFFTEYRIAVPGQPLRWVECRGRLIKGPDDKPFRFSGTAVDVTARKIAEQQKQLLMEELSHRVKNTFAVVQAIASQTLRGAEPAIRASFVERLTALGRAHEVLLQTEWASTPIHALMDAVLILQANNTRFDMDGQDITLNSKTALSLSLLVHELATNAVKYGALSSEQGKVHVRWAVEGDKFVLTWDERGGPPATQPERGGFGSRLIGLGINGTRDVKLVYEAEGFSARFNSPFAAVADD
jgi:PAS domain S-box-containing protein